MGLYGYYRVSTKRRAKEGKSLERYREQLLKAGVPETNIFFDVESGGTVDRAGYQDLLARLRGDTNSCLIVPCFDRLHRSTLNWEVARKEFQSLGIELRVLDEGLLDFSSPDGHFNITIKAAAAELVRETNQRRALEGHKYLREKRIAFSAPFGYRIIEGKPVFDDRPYLNSGIPRHQVAREAIDFLLAGKTPREIMNWVVATYGFPDSTKCFPRSSTGFYQWLRTETLRGILVFRPKGKILTYPDNHPALISMQEWLEIEKIIQRFKRHHKAKANTNPLLGIAFCGNCGGPMTLQQSHGKYFYLVCGNAVYKDRRKPVCSESSTYGLRVADYVKAVTDALRAKSRELVEWGWASPDVAESPEILELQNQINRLDPNDPDLQSAIAAKQSRLNYLIESSKVANQSEEKAIAELVAIAEDERFWELASYSQLNILFRDTVASVIHNKGSITVNLKI